MTSPPLVSIGLPTYNRAEKLERAMEYILGQSYPNIEVVISDNASSDRTPEICAALCSRDPRIRYIRQKQNIGPTANYRAVLEAATGDMYMPIADDDWLAENYVEACVSFLVANSEYALVCGVAEMHRDGHFSHMGVRTLLDEASPEERVVSYFRTVSENSVFHGVARRDLLMSIPPVRTWMGYDWCWIASIAVQGKICTLESTRIIKHLGGATINWHTIASVVGLPKWQADYWSEAILINVLSEIAWRSPAYAPLGQFGRLALASRVGATLAFKWRIWNRWRGYLRQLSSPHMA